MADESSYFEFFKDKRRIYFVAVIMFGIAFALFFWWHTYIYPYESTDDANIDGVEIDVSAEMGGRILELFVDEGTAVKEGDLLFLLDDKVLVSQKEEARAAIVNAQDRVFLQRVRVALAEKDFMRARQEFGSQVISEEMMDHVQKALEAAQAELAVIQSEVVVQEAHFQMIETQIAKTKVYAPSPGVIAKRWHFPGDVVGGGQTVFSLFNLAQIWVTANLEETKLSSVHFNDPVKIYVDAYPDLEFEGNVEVIGAGAASQFSLIPPNNASGNFTKVTQRVPIRISLKPPYSGDTLYLRPGMSAEIKIRTR